MENGKQWKTMENGKWKMENFKNVFLIEKVRIG
jgi:hypothetical protein